MNQDTARRFAALAVHGITADQAGQVIAEYLSQVALCSMCGGTGVFVPARKIEISVEARSRPNPAEPVFLRPGKEMACLHCGGRDEDGVGGFDPEFVKWQCARGDGKVACRDILGGTDDFAIAAHVECGYRLVLPFDQGPFRHTL